MTLEPPGTVRYIADHLVPMDLDGSVHSPGVVDVADGTVQWSGPAADAPLAAGSTQRLRGVLMPGFVNAHAHTPMVLVRGAGEGLPTDVWLRDVMWPRESRLTADDVGWAMRLGAAEMVANGITTSSEMYFYGDAIARGAADVGLRCIVAAPLIEAPEFAHLGTIDDQIEAIRAMRTAWAHHPLIEIGVGPHSAYAVSSDALAAVAELAAADPMLVHIHVAEQRDEGAAVHAATGLTVPAYLDRLGLLTTRTIGAHCVWVTADDIELLAARGVTVAHCPVSNGRHASGIAPVAALRSRGIGVGLGTDGPASHDRLDMFEEMRTAARFARVASHDAASLDAWSVLAMATAAGADSLGRPDLGRLTEGARADMILLDLSAAIPGVGSAGVAPVESAAELVGRIVWAGSPDLVGAVWIGGRQLVVDGRCTSIDVGEAAVEVSERARALATG